MAYGIDIKLYGNDSWINSQKRFNVLRTVHSEERWDVIHTSDVPKFLSTQLANYRDGIYIYHECKFPRFAQIDIKKRLTEEERWPDK